MNKLSQELISLQSKKTNLLSTKASLEDEVSTVASYNRAMDEELEKKKAQLLMTSKSKQDTLLSAQNEIEKSIREAKEEQATYKRQIMNLLSAQEKVDGSNA
jgi:chromosome segregation ATPase